MTGLAPPPHPAGHQRPAHRTRDDHLAAPPSRFAAPRRRPTAVPGDRPDDSVRSGNMLFFRTTPVRVPGQPHRAPSARIPVLTDPPPSTRPRTGEPAHDQHPARRPPSEA